MGCALSSIAVVACLGRKDFKALTFSSTQANHFPQSPEPALGFSFQFESSSLSMMKIQSFFAMVTALFSANPIFCTPAAEDELFLTPLIKKGELKKARAQAKDNMRISNITILSGKEVTSYSGYLTIDEESHSNLFFWFFPAQESPEKAPVILWVNEVQGFSSVREIFLETGPFKVGPNNVVTERKESWTKSHSMLYIDSPVGTGFSFSSRTDKYVRSFGAEGNQIYEALTQFFTLFHDFQSADFYLAGEHLAATVIPYVVKQIERENGKRDLKIKVKGFMIGSPFMDSSQLHKAQALYDLGLIDMEQKRVWDETIEDAIDMVMHGEVEEGTRLAASTYVGPGILAEFTGFEDDFNALASKPPREIGWLNNFIDSKEVHKYLHVGVHKYIGANIGVLVHFGPQIFTSHGVVFEELLNKGYRVLVYAPQFDIYNPQSGVSRVVSNLKWNGAEKFAKANRKVWRVNDDVAGYVKVADNFVYAIVRNAGHYAIMDQPAWMNDLVEKFLYQKEF